MSHPTTILFSAGWTLNTQLCLTAPVYTPWLCHLAAVHRYRGGYLIQVDKTETFPETLPLRFTENVSQLRNKAQQPSTIVFFPRGGG